MDIQDFLQLKREKEYIFLKDNHFLFPDKKRKRGKLFILNENGDRVRSSVGITFGEFEENANFAKGIFNANNCLNNFNGCFYKPL
jgi:hypothetical protein